MESNLNILKVEVRQRKEGFLGQKNASSRILFRKEAKIRNQ